jgi:hypothetical protein
VTAPVTSDPLRPSHFEMVANGAATVQSLLNYLDQFASIHSFANCRLRDIRERLGLSHFKTEA